MIEKNNLNISALCDWFTIKGNNFACYLIRNKEENSNIVNYKVSDNEDWFLPDFVEKNAVIDSLNEHLDIFDAGFTVTDYEIDREAGYIQFKIE